jgi:hypothetical protein
LAHPIKREDNFMLIFSIVSGILIIIILISKFYTKWVKKHTKMTPSEVADVIESFITDTCGDWDWDDFIYTPINDDKLNRIRIQCGEIALKYPPTEPGHYTNEEGINVLRQYVKELRAMEKEKNKDKHKD